MLIRYAPFKEVEMIEKEINKLFNDFFKTFQSGYEYPLLDIVDTKDNLVIYAEIPGVSKDDVKVKIHNDVLTISGERKEPEVSEKANCLIREREFGKFMRSVRLPYPIDVDKVSAEYKDGILKIILPKKEEAKPKEIQINVN
ncbi:HSP20 family protein [Candidatus Kryptobacter tengchongensis]|nr:Hsp20/alpha crystallin family protein [Candidatus Kryptobacter tengchongensis]CUS83418.1 HSP20 family protein [Candidatus Kryptobacter tengchongensis]CUU06241.1 HSP20 family protein [Candidatus Kryptobacter tengchongensis]